MPTESVAVQRPLRNIIGCPSNFHHSMNNRRIRQPNHGVSGYQTTGQIGDFQFQFHDNVQIGQRDVAASRYGLQSHASSSNEFQENQFNAEFNRPASITQQEITGVNTGGFYMEPSNSEEAESTYQVASKLLSHSLQRKMTAQHGTYLKDRMYEGFGQYDPAVQHMVRDLNYDSAIEAPPTPAEVRHREVSFAPPIRQNDMQRASVNNANMINALAPLLATGRGPLDNLLNPAFSNQSNVAPGTHITSGESVSQGLTRDSGNRPLPGEPFANFQSGLQGPLYISLYPPPDADIRPTGYAGTPEVVDPELAQPLVKGHDPVQTQL